jgi:pSer/pThr/pTyr-binding forkhead associated (FHA) protein
MVPEGFKFCGVCGTRYEQASIPAAVPMPVESQSVARLILIHPDGTEGEAFALEAGETTIGREHELALFSNDPFLSPRHATFYFVRGQLLVRDEASLNGVFLRIKAEVELFHRDMFRIGQQLLRFEEMNQIRPVVVGAKDGTTVMGSPVRGAWGRLALVVGIDSVASVWALRRPEEQIGRERGEVVFPEDGFVSGAHCKLVARDGRFFLRDVGSTNGSYLRVKGEGILAQGDLLLLGQQLFKVDLLY